MPTRATPGFSRTKHLAFGLVTGLVLFGLSLVGDRILGLAGFAGEPPVSAPPFYERVYDNLEFSYTLKTNERGLRYRSIPEEKPPGVRRLVLLGDSYAEGMGVEVEQRWSNLLEDRARARGEPTLEVVNCAETGSSPFNYGQKLFHLCIDYDPDGVLLALYINDIVDTTENVDPGRMLPGATAPRSTRVRRIAYALWPHVYVRIKAATDPYGTRAPVGDLLDLVKANAREQGIDEGTIRAWEEAIPPDLLAAAEAGTITPSVLTYPLTRPRYYRESLDLDSARARAKLATVLEILDTIREACSARGIPLGLVLVPSVYQYDPASANRVQARLYERVGSPMRPEWREQPTRLQEELRRWAEGARVPFLDLWETFREAVKTSEQPLTFAIDIHWTTAGHQVAADAIDHWMQEHGSWP